MESPLLFFLILPTITFTDPGHSQIIYPSENPVQLGKNVTIISNTTVNFGTWTFNNSLLTLIYPGGFRLSNDKSGRLIFNSSTSSLTIKSAQLADSGVYKLAEIDKFSVHVELSVQEPISNVTLSAQRTDLVEFNDTAVFICSVSTGSSLSYKWLAENSTISNMAGVQLSNGGANLTIVGLTHYDEGPYRCNVSNGLGYNVSLPVRLNISYGPNNATMKVDPVKYMYRSGSNITLWCSVESRPTAMVQWMFDGVNLNQSGSQLHLQNIKENNSGTYKCLFHNMVTMRFSSVSTEIRVMDPLSAVVVSQADGPAILDEAFTLQCEATGPVGSIQWWKNGSLITLDNRTTFGNKTLTLNPVQLSDGGLYMCHVSNLVSNMTSDLFAVVVNYGPMMPTVMGPNVVKSGNTGTFKCAAESVPPSLYQWHFNGSVVSNMSEYTTPSLTKEMSGKYICMALNNITGKNSTNSIMLTVVDPIQNVTVQAQNDSAIEGNPHDLTCNVIGPADHIYWMKDDEPLYLDNRNSFFINNMTVRFMALKRSDTGYYQCLAVNAVGNMTSEPYNLLVAYGPDTPQIMGPKVAKTGDNVTLTCLADSAPPSLYQWHFNGSLVSSMSEYMTPSLTEQMSREYTCTAINSISGKNSTASIILRVIDPIRNVQVEAQMNLAVEGHPYNLTCRVNETVDHIYWMRNSEKLNPDNKTIILMENMTMSFMSIQRNYSGNYTCMAANAVGNMTSKPFMLLVNYGPDTPVIMGPRAVKTGDNATLRCHAKSVPQSLYQWHFNGSLVSTMSEYVTPPLTQEVSWEYTCMALNNITGKNSSASIMLTVVDPIQSVEIQAQMNYAMENYSYNLTCNVTGPADYIYWMKSGNLLLEDNRTVFDMDNKTVMLLALNRSDNGHYQCVAVNALGNITSAQYKLFVIYGPEMPIISGSNPVKPGSSATLSCNAPSYPPSFYRWYFNDTLVSNMSEYVTPPVTEEKSLKFMCMAFNNITEKNSTASITITAIASIKNVQIDTPTSNAMEGYSYNLTCNVTGAVDKIYWMKNGEQLHPDNSRVFSMNKTVKFMPVDRIDAGDYVCMAVNAVGNLTSSAYMLQVIFGPDEPIIYGPNFGEAGRNVDFSCSAASMPPSTYSWWFNDSLMANTSEFTAGPLSFNMSGAYTCVAHNYVTGKNSTNSTTLTVIEGIDSVMIKNNSIPISNENFTLTCLVVGSYDALYWMKDGMALSLNASDPASSMYIIEDNFLHFTQLTTQSNGAYQCVATNKAALHTSQQYKLLVNYGPLNMNISGPESAKEGASVSLNCTADSYPECEFYWFLNNKSSLLKNGSLFSFSATRRQVGNYICVATNPVTNVTMTQTKSFAIADHASTNHITNKGAVLLMGLCSVLVHLLLL